MICGDKNIFAIEYSITHAYERPSFKGLGFFLIFINGKSYGVKAPNATMLACSIDSVISRLQSRDHHVTPFASNEDAGEIADAFLDAVYNEERPQSYFGLSIAEINAIIRLNHVTWAPDGDEAFDDGSFILQFDIGDAVRLIGFRRLDDGHHDPISLGDISIKATIFYDILQEFLSKFEAEWQSLPKIPEGSNG